MDEIVAKWVIEYLLPQPIDEKIINDVLSILPLPNSDNRIKKLLLLRRIDSEISNGTISEKILDFLEIIEELDHRDGKSAPESMKSAYCAVAVDVTVRFLADDVENNEKYLEMVRKVWKKRFRLIESLQSQESERWMSEIEAAVDDLEVRERIRRRNTRYEGLEAVRVYLKEAWGCIGPPFLELVAGKVGDVVDGGGCCGGGSGGGAVVENRCRDLVLYQGTQMDRMPQPTRRKLKPRRGAQLSHTDETTEDEPMTESQCHNGDDRNEDQPLNKRKSRRHGDKENEHDDMPGTQTTQTPQPTRHKCVATKLTPRRGAKLSNTDQRTEDEPTNAGQHLSGDDRNEDKPPNKTKHRRAHDEGNEDEPTSKRKHHGEGNQHEPMNISKTSLPSNDFQTVQDPLPDAHQTANNVNVNETTEVNDDHRENSIGVSEKIDGLMKNGPKSRVPTRRSLMEPNETSHTIEWSDSIDNSGDPLASRPRVGTQRGSYDGGSKMNKRRARKFWSAAEEQTLREGVNRFGKGNWKLILHCYRDMFQDRTEVDLKDKWRNMTRSS